MLRNGGRAAALCLHMVRRCLRAWIADDLRPKIRFIPHHCPDGFRTLGIAHCHCASECVGVLARPYAGHHRAQRLAHGPTAAHAQSGKATGVGCRHACGGWARRGVEPPARHPDCCTVSDVGGFDHHLCSGSPTDCLTHHASRQIKVCRLTGRGQ